MTPPKEWREFIESLNSHRVEYLIVGAVAMAHHGVPRFTGDMDILVRPSPENAARVLAALHSFGFGSLGLKDSDFTVLEQVIQLGFPPVRIDLLTSLSGVSFAEAWEGRVQGTLGASAAPFLGRAELTRNKRATGRPQDLADLKLLETG